MVCIAEDGVAMDVPSAQMAEPFTMWVREHGSDSEF